MSNKNSKGNSKRPTKERASDNKHTTKRYGSNSSESRSKEKCESKGKTKSTSNDVTWYAKNEQILKDAASIPFFNPVGQPLRWLDVGVGETDNGQAVAIPGVMGFEFTPVPGISKDRTSPVNVAAQAVYSWVVHANSRNTRYEPEDLMMYFLAMDSAYVLYTWMTRVYGTMLLYNQMNRYLPDTLLKAQNIDPEDFRKHIADFRAFINTWVCRLGTLYVPATFDLYKRHSWMCSGYYADAPTANAQIMLYTPTQLWLYDEKTSSTGTKLVPGSMRLSQPFTFDTLKTFATNMLDRLVLSEDVNIMAGDILKCYGTEGIYKLTTIPEDFVIIPGYDEEVLYQMKHTISGMDDGIVYSDITQSPATGVHFAASFSIGEDYQGSVGKFKRMLSYNKPEVSPADIMVSTRLMPCLSASTDSEELSIPIVSCGSELVDRIAIYGVVSQNGTFTITKNPINQFHELNTTVQPGSILMEGALEVAELSQFQFAPYVYLILNDPTAGQPKAYRVYHVIGDVDNYTLIGSDNLEKLHLCALLSEFDVPRLGLV